MVTLEQVEKLREYANISYEEARAALEETNGDILEALVNLEKQNRIIVPKGGGYYNSRSKYQDTYENRSGDNYKNEYKKVDGSSFGELVGRFFRWCGEIINRGNRNSFEVMRGEQKVISIPVTILALLLLFMFWVTIPLIIVGLFFGYRYMFIGPDLGKENVNRAMDSVAEVAESLKKEVKGDKSNGENFDN
ncbi:UBA/Ts-N domain-containing protein [Proteiniborus sp. DW1]|uniref:DUF4342 domain-containing protein n=1 Tax=Proteiniborus sp. DW1 TaxID=1889883 RepID=UPI00092E18C8|nr:DUF4342 domain-containing protein [Proteiniborus sp. DW1]SCG82898.1 UBA/Ts-N domain-containing protein [Proteiniborus sp. DW1]